MCLGFLCFTVETLNKDVWQMNCRWITAYLVFNSHFWLEFFVNKTWQRNQLQTCDPVHLSFKTRPNEMPLLLHLLVLALFPTSAHIFSTRILPFDISHSMPIKKAHIGQQSLSYCFCIVRLHRRPVVLSVWCLNILRLPLKSHSVTVVFI